MEAFHNVCDCFVKFCVDAPSKRNVSLLYVVKIEYRPTSICEKYLWEFQIG